MCHYNHVQKLIKVFVTVLQFFIACLNYANLPFLQGLIFFILSAFSGFKNILSIIFSSDVFKLTNHFSYTYRLLNKYKYAVILK